jgi:hypothetical protein
MSKYFVIGDKTSLSKSAIQQLEKDKAQHLRAAESEVINQSKKQIEEEDNLTHVFGRIIVKVDMEMKNSFRFEDGTTIRLERKYNEFNRRITQPVNCIVISGEGIEKNAEILVSHNALHETNRINDYKNTFENDESNRIRYYSIPDYECFAWRIGLGEWKPIKGFQFGLRVFKPYEGMLTGISPTTVKDILFITTGYLKDNVCHVLKASDYQLIFQGDDGKEKYIIRLRHSDEEEIDREEVVAIDHDLTQKVLNGNLLIGYEVSNAKQFQINAYAD